MTFTLGVDDGLLLGLNVGLLVGAEVGLMPIMNRLKRRKSRVPRPEAGSQPGAALKPSLQQLFTLVQLFLPTVMSFVNKLEFPYSTGLRKPTGLPPALNLAAFTRDIMPATIGAPTDVPPTP